jgi:hypothetical protein
MNNPEKLPSANIGYSWLRKKKQKYNTLCVEHHYVQTNMNNVYKTWTLLKTTGGKDEPNIVPMWKPQQTPQHGTQSVKTHNRTTQKIWTQMLTKGKQFLSNRVIIITLCLSLFVISIYFLHLIFSLRNIMFSNWLKFQICGIKHHEPNPPLTVLHVLTFICNLLCMFNIMLPNL